MKLLNLYSISLAKKFKNKSPKQDGVDYTCPLFFDPLLQNEPSRILAHTRSNCKKCVQNLLSIQNFPYINLDVILAKHWKEYADSKKKCYV